MLWATGHQTQSELLCGKTFLFLLNVLYGNKKFKITVKTIVFIVIIFYGKRALPGLAFGNIVK